MAEIFPDRAEPEQAEIAAYVDQNLDGYVADLAGALKATAATGSAYADIARPVLADQTRVEVQGRDQILERLKEHFLPQYPNRVMDRIYRVEHGGNAAKEMDPPALCFEVIRFFVPQQGDKTASGDADTRVDLV
ncbi:MAG: hypothetical protein JWO35_120 [Candidatus Saccharibacteria bacterium]|nr:hypothetical protein [Candidatus Saccharibacteria bacterium]